MIEPELIEEKKLEDGNYATVLTLKEQMCKWPISDPGSDNFHFCGQSASPASPYCAAHTRIAYQASTSRRDRKRGLKTPTLPPIRRAAG